MGSPLWRCRVSQSTVKPALTRRKRPKRDVENDQFDAFVRRILRAYARRVASGDVEALRTLVTLTSELDATVRLAVAGLREVPYSWAEIANRLGVSRQAAQMRYGNREDRGALDQRLTAAGLGVSVALLVQVFADHHPGIPPAATCPACGYHYPQGLSDCPTNATVRPLLYRRRTEDKKALDRLTPDQFADLHNRSTARKNRVAAKVVQLARPAASPDHTAQNLLNLVNGKD